MDGPQEQARRHYAGREIDPVEAASIHIALEELRDRPDAFLEVEVAEDDTAERIEGNCLAIADELRLRLRVAVTGTRHVRDALGLIGSEPSVLQISLDYDRE